MTYNHFNSQTNDSLVASHFNTFFKADFNAGVVAAGEAQIESTVIGNSSPFETTDEREALINQSQVYLPINNALSEVG